MSILCMSNVIVTVSKTPAPLEDQLEQAARELIRYLWEFPHQDVFETEEIAEWYCNVVLPLKNLSLGQSYLEVCNKYYPEVLERLFKE